MADAVVYVVCWNLSLALSSTSYVICTDAVLYTDAGKCRLPTAFSGELLHAISAPIVFAELAEVPWLRVWWSQVIGFMHRLAKLSDGSLHADILSDNINDALHGASPRNWAAGIQRHYAHLGLASPFSGDRLQNVNAHGFQRAMLAQENTVWQGLAISPRTAPSARAKLCTYLRWFARPAKVAGEPYYELPMSITKLRLLFHFRMGSHSLPVEQGRLGRSSVPRHLRRCTLCTARAVGDERHCVFDCPCFGDLRQEMRSSFMMLIVPCVL